MTDLSALKDLRDKVAAGTATKRDFILSDLVPHDRSAFRAFSGSLDAAKALHEALLPGWGWHCGVYGARVWEYPGDEWHPERRSDVEMPENPARAWLLAILTAFIAKECQ